MIYNLLLNINNLLFYFLVIFIVCLLIYAIYKIFILENEIYLLTDKIAKIEIEYGSGPTELIKQNEHHNMRNYDLKMNEIIMNNIFSDTNIMENESPNNSPKIDIIEMDNVILTDETIEDTTLNEPIFDLKKEVLTDDRDSVISSNATKKKLLKLNLDRLKDKCTEYGLPTDGTKAQLIERILERDQ